MRLAFSPAMQHAAAYTTIAAENVAFRAAATTADALVDLVSKTTSNKNHLKSEIRAAVWRVLYADADRLEFSNPINLNELGLWMDIGFIPPKTNHLSAFSRALGRVAGGEVILSNVFWGQWKRLRARLEAFPGEHWEVWTYWYNAIFHGDPSPWSQAVIDVLIDEKLRNEQNPAVVNAAMLAALQVDKSNLVANDPPPIPAQGTGPHVEIDPVTGTIVPVKPGSLDADGNNIARLRAQHPQLIDLAKNLLASINHNEHPELHAAVQRYLSSIDRDLGSVDFDRLYGEGLYLEEAADAAKRDVLRLNSQLEDNTQTALNTLVRLHGPFILASEAGIANLAAAREYDETPAQAKESQQAAIELAAEFKAHPEIISPELAQNFEQVVNQPDSTTHPNRTAAYREGMARNITIVGASMASMATPVILGLILVGPIGGAAGGILALPILEGLKKSKAFLEVSGLVTEKLDDMREADVRALRNKLSKIPFKEYAAFMRKNEHLFRKIAGDRKHARWLHDHLDWLKAQEIGGEEPRA